MFITKEIKVDITVYFGMGYYEPLYVMTNIEPKEALRIYLQRMKIDESFRDNKSLLGIEKMMSKKRYRMSELLAGFQFYPLIFHFISIIIN